MGYLGVGLFEVEREPAAEGLQGGYGGERRWWG